MGQFRGEVTNVAWDEAYVRTKWHLDPSSHLATTDMGQKLGGLCPFGGEGGSPSNTMWPRPTFVPSCILVHNTWAENWGLLCPPFWRGGSGSPSNTMSPWPRPTSVPSSILIHPTLCSVTLVYCGQSGQDTQRSDGIGRNVLQTVAQKCWEYHIHII